MNTLVHIIWFCARESVVHAQKEHKVYSRIKCSNCCVHYLGYYNKFKSNEIGMYIMRQIKKLTWLQAFILGDMRVIWCHPLGDSHFQIYVMNFVEIVINHYLLITLHVSQAFASCIHYTSYSLLNFVHYIVCDLVVAIQD